MVAIELVAGDLLDQKVDELAPLRIAQGRGYLEHADRQLDVGTMPKRPAFAGVLLVPRELLGRERMAQGLAEKGIVVE